MKVVLIDKDYAGYTVYARKVYYNNIKELFKQSELIIDDKGDIIRNRFSSENFVVFTNKNIECLKNMVQFKIYKSLNDVIVD